MYHLKQGLFKLFKKTYQSSDSNYTCEYYYIGIYIWCTKIILNLDIYGQLLLKWGW